MDGQEILIDLDGDVPFEELYELVAGCYVACLMDIRQGLFPPESDIKSYRVMIDRLRSSFPEDWRRSKEKILLIDWFTSFLNMVERVNTLPAGVGSIGECVEILGRCLGREYPGLFRSCAIPGN